MFERLSESSLLLIVGMGGVFASLLVISGMIWVFKFVDETLNSRRVKKYAEKVEQKSVDPDHNDELIAVVSAAVAATLLQPVTVRRIRFLGDTSGESWTSAGRGSIMASHTIKKK